MGSLSPNKRCVNIDWLELYVLESAQRYPMDAEYFRNRGYWVTEREYGTRSYNQMFTISDEHGDPWIEVRRDPQSGNSAFTGMVPESCHIRLVNRQCYDGDCVRKLMDFIAQHDYIFKRIFRIDICLDFEYFDSGDKPERFATRYLQKKYRKINQAKLSTVGNDSWGGFDWEYLAWGNKASMVSTKLYNKTRELAAPSHDKPYIKQSWFECGLIDDPVRMTKLNRHGELYKPEIWRVEFSLKSSADHWIVIEDMTGKRVKHKAIPHDLPLFMGRDRLLQRFEELAYHYFRFKVSVYKGGRKGAAALAIDSVYHWDERELQRKDRCPDKVLFRFNKNREIYQVKQVASGQRPERAADLLLRKLREYRSYHADRKLREACDVIIKDLEQQDLKRFTLSMTKVETEALQRAIALRLGGDSRQTLEIISDIKEMLSNDLIF